MGKKDIGKEYSDEETVRREDASLKRILSTPPKPHSEMKLGKRKSKDGMKANPQKKQRQAPKQR